MTRISAPVVGHGDFVWLKLVSYGTEFGMCWRCLSDMEEADGSMPGLTSVESSASSVDCESG